MFSIGIRPLGDDGWCLYGRNRTKWFNGEWVVFPHFCLKHWDK